jgi:hypothetical protein
MTVSELDRGSQRDERRRRTNESDVVLDETLNTKLCERMSTTEKIDDRYCQITQ